MIYSFGRGLEFKSTGGTGFNTINQTFNGEYTEQTLVDGAMSVKRGIALNKQVMTAQWIGTDKTSHIDVLKALVNGNHQVSDQDGKDLGVWTVDSIAVNGSDVFAGGLVCFNVTLNLTEYR